MDQYEEYFGLAKKYLSDIITYQTVNESKDDAGNEQDLAEYIGDILKNEGFETEIQVVLPSRANLVAKIGHSQNKIILTGHLDVVPAGSGWATDPFQLVEKNGKLYGRGSSDMKGALAAMMAAAVKINREKTLRDAELMIVFVMDEEYRNEGTKFFVRHSNLGEGKNWVVLGEPTENQVHVSHRGVVRFYVDIYGVQCHSGKPETGLNAITLASKFALEIDKANQKRYGHGSEYLPAPSVAVTEMHGGVKNNIVPGYCRITVDFRTTPGQNAQTLRAEMDEILENICHGLPAKWEYTVLLEENCGFTDPDSKIVHVAKKAYQNLYGEEPIVTYCGATCDQNYFNDAGYEAIIMGPGNMDVAHQLDEFIEENLFLQSVILYEQFVLEAQKKIKERDTHEKEDEV